MNRKILPLGLIVMDGWGEAPPSRWNAVRGCNPENLEALRAAYPATLLETSGAAVGLPPGQIGNSEVGHLCLGAGRIVLTDLDRINREIETGSFEKNPVLNEAIRAAVAAGGAIHLMGLFSDGGVHSHIDHLRALLAMLRKKGARRVFVHAFLDGRDTPPRSALGFMRAFEAGLGPAVPDAPNGATDRRSAPAAAPDSVAGLRSASPTVSNGTPGGHARAAAGPGAPDGGQESGDPARESGSGYGALSVRIASVIGRYYAMDRDNRWDRIELAYRALVRGEGFRAPSGVAAIEAGYARGEGDEFIKPTLIAQGADAGAPAIGPILDRDAVIFFNFRADRAREMTRALTADAFDQFERGPKPKLSAYVCFGTYDRTLDLPVAFSHESPARILGDLLAEAGLRQLRIAETEKYAHVTFFFNGGRETVFEREERILVPSPRIATYDLQPEMSAPEVTARLLERLRARTVDFFLLNFANADMVGHSGIYEAAVAACKVVDQSVGTIVREVLAQGGSVLVTADHGNSEQMWDFETNSPHTAHTTNPVPCIFASEALKGRVLRSGGVLADVAPTLVEVLDMKQPREMTGRSLLASPSVS